MKIILAETELETDYWYSPDCVNGLPWCLIRDDTWHILLPFGCSTSMREIRAYPVRDRSEPDAWRWRLVLSPHQHLKLYSRCTLPFRQGYPSRGLHIHAIAMLYTHQSASLIAAAPGIQKRGCTLLLMRA